MPWPDSAAWEVAHRPFLPLAQHPLLAFQVERPSFLASAYRANKLVLVGTVDASVGASVEASVGASVEEPVEVPAELPAELPAAEESVEA